MAEIEATEEEKETPYVLAALAVSLASDTVDHDYGKPTNNATKTEQWVQTHNIH